MNWTASFSCFDCGRPITRIVQPDDSLPNRCLDCQLHAERRQTHEVSNRLLSQVFPGRRSSPDDATP